MEKDEVKHLFVLAEISLSARRRAFAHLTKMGIRVTAQHGKEAMVGECTPDQARDAESSGYFSGVFARKVSEEEMKEFPESQRREIEQWSFTFTDDYKSIRDDTTHRGKSWADEGMAPPREHTLIDPDYFKEQLLGRIGRDEDRLIAEYREKEPAPRTLEGAEFTEYESELASIYGDRTIAYYLARIAKSLPPYFQYAILEYVDYIWDFFRWLFAEPSCWKLENEISVGVVFVESSQAGGPTFTAADRTAIRQEIIDGLTWLSNQEPDASISWVYDWQYVTINVNDGTGAPAEDYWRNPAMQQVNYNGNTYTGDWDGVGDYREDMRTTNLSAHSVVIFVTPYTNGWFAYAAKVPQDRITLARRCGRCPVYAQNNWGNWGLTNLDRLTAHEMCHLFHATDEYTGTGTPCSSCGGSWGCFNIPNGNCGVCANPFQTCLMDGNDLRLCGYTQGHIGWADLLVEVTTADEADAGSSDEVWFDIGPQKFKLETPGHVDRQRGNVEAYPLNYSGVKKNDIRRVRLEKGLSPGGSDDPWRPQHIRVWCSGELVCDSEIGVWLNNERRTWTSRTCGVGTWREKLDLILVVVLIAIIGAAIIWFLLNS